MTLDQIIRRRWSQPSDQPGSTATFATYDEALAQAMDLAPRFRNERALCASFIAEPDQPVLATSTRWMLNSGIVAATSALALLVADAPSAVVLALGALFGLAAVASGDHLGGTVRGIAARGIWSAPVTAIVSALLDGALLAVLTVSATIIAEMPAAGAIFAALASAAGAVGFASRNGDAEAEARIAAHKAAADRQKATEDAVRRATDALRAAHATDLARIAAEMGEVPTTA